MASGVGCYQTIPAALNCLSGLTTLEPLRRSGRDLTLKNRQLCYPACQVTMTGDGWRLGSHASEDMTALHVHSLHALIANDSFISKRFFASPISACMPVLG